MLYELKLKRATIDEHSGKEKLITEYYLCDAVSFTDAEKQAYQLAEGFGDWKLENINPVTINDIIAVNESDQFYNLSAVFMTEDEKSGKLTKQTLKTLVTADSPKEAIDSFKDWSKDHTVDYTVKKVSQSRIVDCLFEIREGVDNV